MPLGLYPNETAQALEPGVGEGGTSAPPAPGFFQGVGKATALGVGEGAIKVGALAGDTDLSGALSPNLFPEAPPVTEQTPEEHQAHLDQATAQAVAAFTPDPHTTGAAGEILHGVASGLTRFVAGAAAGGPVAGAGAVGLTEGETQAAQLRAQGVDADTAKLAGLGTGLMAGAGSLLPGGVGAGVASRVATGAAMQATAGMINRGMMHSVLADAGYDQMAEAYKPLDGQAVLTDMVLGSAFGGVHHLFAPSVIDAAHTAADSVHVEDAAPGVPITPESRQAHVDNMSAAAEALLSGKDMPELQPVETIPNPAQDALRSTNADAVTDVAAEVAGEPVQAPVEFERRQDAIDSGRMLELRQKGFENLTPDESLEYNRLAESDRLSAKVGGRRIEGLQSREAYEEMVGRGEQKPAVAYFDLDMFKNINDHFGESQGDEAIRAAGQAAAHYAGTGNAFKGSERAGDEFIMQGDSPEGLQTKIDALRQHLSNHKIRAYDAQGNLIKEQTGIDFSHGIGKDAIEAGLAAKVAKAERQRLGLRTDRGTVPEKSAARSESEGRPAAGSKTGAVKTPIQATSALSKALLALRDSDGTDEGSHAQVRSILQDVQSKGMDSAAIERAAVERAGNGADEALAGAKAAESARLDTGGLDPETKESVDAVEGILGDHPEIKVTDADGQEIPARAALQRALDDLKQAAGDDELHKVAAACFGRMG